MKLTKTLTLAALLIGTLPAMSGLNSAALAASDPTSGRIQGQQRLYKKCTRAAYRSYRYTLDRANGDPVRINQAKYHYNRNVAGCRARYL